MKSTRHGNIPALPNDILDVCDVTLLRGNMMDFRFQRLGQSKSHRSFSGSRWTNETPRRLVRISRKFGENTFRLAQSNEVGDTARTIFLCQWHRKREGCAHWQWLPSA